MLLRPSAHGALHTALPKLHRYRKWLLSISGTFLVFALTVCHIASCTTSSRADQSIRYGEHTLAYERIGNPTAPRVILIHGAPADSACWPAAMRESLADAYDVILVDRLGYGHSSQAVVAPLAEQGAAIASLLGQHTILVGHSHGGPVALYMAAAYPDQVNGLVLVAGACDADMKDSIWFREFVSFLGILVPRTWQVANRELLALNRDGGENDRMQSMLNRVTCPVRVLHGTWDAVCPYEGTTGYLQTHLTRTSVEIITFERSGHNLHISEPEAIVNAIDQLAGH